MKHLTEEPVDYQISVIINNMIQHFGEDKVKNCLKTLFGIKEESRTIFGREVDEMLFMGQRLMIYFTDGNNVCINFKETSFQDPLVFLNWIDTQNEQQRKAA